MGRNHWRKDVGGSGGTQNRSKSRSESPSTRGLILTASSRSSNYHRETKRASQACKTLSRGLRRVTTRAVPWLSVMVAVTMTAVSPPDGTQLASPTRATLRGIALYSHANVC
jgi:hypothetical protein